MIARAEEICEEPGTFYADQFNNVDAMAGYVARTPLLRGQVEVQARRVRGMGSSARLDVLPADAPCGRFDRDLPDCGKLKVPFPPGQPPR